MIEEKELVEKMVEKFANSLDTVDAGEFLEVCNRVLDTEYTLEEVKWTHKLIV